MMREISNRLVILDRDGVINFDSDEYIKSLAEWVPIPGSIEAIARLSKAGYIVTVATNQSGIGRGLFDLDELEKIHSHLCSLVESCGGEISGIFYCPHAPEDNCKCRKPAPGLIEAIEDELSMSAARAFLVGDSLRDIQAGESKGCCLVLVKTGKGEKTLKALYEGGLALPEGTLVFLDLQDFTNHLLDNSLP